MKNADPQDVVVVSVYMLIISIIAFCTGDCIWSRSNVRAEAQYTNTKARFCKTVGGEMGYSKCYKDRKRKYKVKQDKALNKRLNNCWLVR